MKKVYVAPNPVDASLMNDTLQRKGIRGTVQGGSLFNVRGELPMTEDTLPSIWVSPDDYDRALAIIKEAENSNKRATKAKWQCTECQEENPISFEVCWKCKNDRANSPSISIARNQSDNEIVVRQKEKKSRNVWLMPAILVAGPLAAVAVFIGMRTFLPQGPSMELSKQANEFLWGAANRPAVELMQRGRYEDAIGALSDVRDQGKNNVFTDLLDGFLHAKIYDFDEALESLNTAIRNQPDYYRGYLLRSDVYGQISRNDSARADLERAAELIPVDESLPIVMRDKADIALKLGLTSKAGRIVDKAYMSNTKLSGKQQAMLHEIQADIAFANGRFDKAAMHIDKAISFGGSNDTRYLKRGQARLKNKQPEDALSDFNSALALNGRNADALAGRAAVSRNQNDCINSVNDLTSAVLLNRQNPNYYFDRAKCHFIGDELDQADTDFRKAIDLNPKFRDKKTTFMDSIRK